MKKRKGRRKPEPDFPDKEKAWGFFQEAMSCEEKKLKSVRLGFSCRYKGPKMVGAALEVDDSIPHLVFFSLEENEEISFDFNEIISLVRPKTRKKNLIQMIFLKDNLSLLLIVNK